VQVDGRRLERPGDGRRRDGRQELVDALDRDVRRQRLCGPLGELGVVGVDGDLLDLVPGHGSAGLRGLRAAPPGPATAVRAGLAHRAEHELGRLGEPGIQGFAVAGRGRCALGVRLRRGLRARARRDDGGLAAAAVAEVLRQFAQRPVRAGRDLDVKVGGGRDRGAERGRAVFDQPQDLGELHNVLHLGCVSQRSGRRVANMSDERVDGRVDRRIRPCSVLVLPRRTIRCDYWPSWSVIAGVIHLGSAWLLGKRR
jgi:hypothetical protein